MPSGVKRTEQEVIAQIKSMDYAEECKKTKEMIKERFKTVKKPSALLTDEESNICKIVCIFARFVLLRAIVVKRTKTF